MPIDVQHITGVTISAVVPNYNHGSTIESAIAALAVQSRAPDEIVVVDDGSTDDSRDRLMRIGSRFPSLRTIYLDRNGGAIAALNRGLSEARGRFVYFGAADDVVLPGLLEALAVQLERSPDVAFASGEARVFDVDTGRVELRPPVLPAFEPSVFRPEEAAALFRRIDNFALTGAALVRRDALSAIGGFDPALEALADGLALRRLAFRHGFCFVPHVGVEWRVSSAGVSRSQAADPVAVRRALAAALAVMRSEPAVPHWYPPLFERRWRFAVGRLAATAPGPQDPDRIAALAARGPLSRAALRAAATVGGWSGALAAVVWLTLQERPTSLVGLARTALFRSRRRAKSASTPGPRSNEGVSHSKGDTRSRMDDDRTSRLDVDAVKAQINAGVAERDTVTRLVNELIARGGAIPPEVELYTLEAYIADDPSRLDLKQRSITVLKQLGRRIPPDREREVLDAYLAEEREIDFQQMMVEYGAKVGLSDLPQPFFDDLDQVRRYTMTSVERLYAMWDAMRYLASAGLPGAVVEAGVWRGGTMMIAALAAMRAGDETRELWLYDTFSGLPRPDPDLDVDILGNRAIDGWEPRNAGGAKTMWAYADEADVRTNMARTKYPPDQMRFISGLVEETIPAQAPERIALLRIDTDWYASYKHILEALYDRVVPGGLVIFDDYGQFKGARRAVDDFIAVRKITSPLLRVDFSCRMLIKTGA